MAKTKYHVADRYKITADHEAQVCEAIRQILRQEDREGGSYSDGTLTEMVLNSGLLTSKGAVYKVRLKNGIPGSHERAIENYAKRHKANKK